MKGKDRNFSNVCFTFYVFINSKIISKTKLSIALLEYIHHRKKKKAYHSFKLKLLCEKKKK
jgi:hypothetical protein